MVPTLDHSSSLALSIHVLTPSMSLSISSLLYRGMALQPHSHDTTTTTAGTTTTKTTTTTTTVELLLLLLLVVVVLQLHYSINVLVNLFLVVPRDCTTTTQP